MEKGRSRPAGRPASVYQPSRAPEVSPHLWVGWGVRISSVDLSGRSGVFVLSSFAPIIARGLF